jgi:tetratricopeptide (TPR) repeat protein
MQPLDKRLEQLTTNMIELVKEKNWNAVLKICAQISQLDPNSLIVYLGSGIAYRNLYDYSKALADLTFFTDHAPHLEQGHIELADVLLIMKMVDGAIAQYKQALSINSGSARAINGLGQALYALGNAELAVRHHMAAIEIEPNISKYHFDLGNAWHELRMYSQAIQAFEKSIALNPTDPVTYFNMGISFYDNELYEQALIAYDHALKNGPTPGLLSDIHNNRTLPLYKLKRYEEVITAAKIVQSMQPEFAPGYYNMGIAYHELGKLEKAIDLYHKAVDLDSHYLDAIYRLGKAYAETNNWKMSHHFFQILSVESPYDGETRHNVGVALYHMGEKEEAIRRFYEAGQMGYTQSLKAIMTIAKELNIDYKE